MLSMQELIEENAFLREENKRLNREFNELYNKAEKKVRIDTNNAFHTVRIDDNRDITPINEKYPDIVEKLEIAKSINPRRFVFKEVPEVNDVTGDVNYHKVAGCDIHNTLRLLTLRVFGVTKNNELEYHDIALAQEFYTNFKNLFLESTINVWRN